ncbi:MAG: PhoH family protein [Candidatus Omnitrophica bacterium]|nr:PhoH family protein [Candidatus Omnitrophota bacterium]
MDQLLGIIRSGQYLRRHEVVYAIRALQEDSGVQLGEIYSDKIEVLSKRQYVVPRTAGQKAYVDAIRRHDIVFAVGVAGTGKSYLSVAMAVNALKRQEVSRIILVRPAVEAGESLGFLPGTFEEKVNPYLRPLYDALYEMMDVDRIQRSLERGVLEVAPLAYMRGRAQPCFSSVLTTPAGFVPIGSLQVGDTVVGSDGAPKRVIGVYPQGRKEIFRVTMQDGASTLCCADHLWAVYTRADRRRNKGFRILETREMLGQLRCAHYHRFELPLISAPVQFPPKPVPMDPYALGLLLGDGCLTGKTTPSFSTGDTELLYALDETLEGIDATWKSGFDYVLRNAGGGRGGVIVANPVTAVLRELELCGTRSSTKFVPSVYLYNSADVRLAVLQGLLDTDGGPVMQAGRTCRIQFVTTSARLRDDVIFLVRSLGGIVYTRTRAAAGRTPGRANGRDVRHVSDAHILDIRLPEHIQPFRLSRKLERYEQSGGGHPARYVDRIERMGEHEAVCIRVDAPDSLYVTDDFIVTHNTLNDSFVILDEAQNCTPEQMKMFLTRLGFDSKTVITGDVTQSDLPQGKPSGLAHAVEVLKGVEGIAFVEFTKSDVVRHELVQKILKAYEMEGKKT